MQFVTHKSNTYLLLLLSGKNWEPPWQICFLNFQKMKTACENSTIKTKNFKENNSVRKATERSVPRIDRK